ncbi:MAG TPA: hypothetical protein PKU80_01410 [Candidatus Limiplasma sp.]|nr:hypothetical protein [Candidatus Limiplasma sp.]HRX08779.1 hypothetical protein [Candidatus Limiplasma sp.]
MSNTVQWLLRSEPYVRYRTLLDLMDQPFDDASVLQARSQMLSSPLVQGLFQELETWPGETITNHKKAGLLYHKLAFLAEIGIRADDSFMKPVVVKILKHISEQGVLELPSRIPVAFGGTGEDIDAWLLCDTPRLYASLLKMGVPYELLKPGVDQLAALIRDNGFPCAGSPKIGRFRGPGKQSDPCPYATLLMLSMLLQVKAIDQATLYTGAQSLLTLWEHSREQSPYLFRMGTDFRKLKAPFIWYDILHVADILSQMRWLHNDQRFLEMLDIIQSKQDDKGCYTPESVWFPWKAWDFGQKKQPSPWLTFLVLRIGKRIA